MNTARLVAPRCNNVHGFKRKTVKGQATFRHCPFFVPAAPVKQFVRDWIEKREIIRLNGTEKYGVEPFAATLDIFALRVAELLDQKPESVKRNLIRKEHGILRADTADAMLVAIEETFRTVDVPVLPANWNAACEMVDAFCFATGEELDSLTRIATADELLAVAHAISHDPYARPAVSPLVERITGGTFPILEDRPQVPEVPVEELDPYADLMDVIEDYLAEAA